MRTRYIAAVALVVYIGAIVLANYLIVHGFPGATATPYGTYTVPVGLGLVAPAGTYMAAVTFPARDVVQRAGGVLLGIVAILIAAVVSWWVSSPAIAVASGGTFLISESFDFAIYTPLRKKFVWAVVASGAVASVVDSLIFLKWAGIPYQDILAGLIVGKLWIACGVGALIAWGLRKRVPLNDGLLPA